MPTLFRFLLWCAMIAGTVYAILLALAYGVEPTKREADGQDPIRARQCPRPDSATATVEQ